jgi:hypothetical protein
MHCSGADGSRPSAACGNRPVVSRLCPHRRGLCHVVYIEWFTVTIWLAAASVAVDL